MELGRSNDRVRERPIPDKVFLMPFADVVSVAVDAINAKNRQQHMMRNTGSLSGAQKMPSRSAEEVPSSVVVSNQRVRHVNDGIDTGQGPIDALSSDKVDAARARQHHRLVPGSAQ
jgi:hypothetical protein